ncbi:MAG: hypothetical protein AB7S38_40200 [Vulcanimicrobiota bacterium]
MSERLLTLFQPGRLVQWPESELAMVRPEWKGRIEATRADGLVAHGPGPMPELQYLGEVDGAWVNPRHARGRDGSLHLPGGWVLEGEMPEAPEAPPRQLEVGVAWRRRRLVWLTTQGCAACELERREVEERFPDWVALGHHLVDPTAVRLVERKLGRVGVELAGGHRLSAAWVSSQPLVERLGVGWPNFLERVEHPQVYERGLRDWPFELRFADHAELAKFDRLNLVEQAVWQTYRLREQGKAAEYGRTPRGLYYVPVVTVAMRAGMLEGEEELGFHPGLGQEGLWEASLGATEGSPGWLWPTLLDRLDLMVGEWALFSYRELGMRDQGQMQRQTGPRKHVVLLTEKASLEEDARTVATMFGTSMLVLGGAPTWIATEFFLDFLEPSEALQIVSFCDFDPYGWHFPEVFARMVERYGCRAGSIVRLVTPRRFSPEELELLAIPLSRQGGKAKIVDEFVRRSGGVNGQAKGLYADYLRPVARLIEAFEAETGLPRL